ncbi:MAG: carboxypeptidase-like regulatory domain-containing protein [Pyrinomonadaceae bacterium]
MIFPKQFGFGNVASARFIVLMLIISLFAISAIAQKSGAGVILAPQSNPDIDQCANGQRPNAAQPCTGANWQNGNINGNNAQYVEGDSVPFRISYSGTPASVVTIPIQWDTTKAGKHAYDYLTTYNRTEVTGNDPCSGVAGCSLSTFTLVPIPIDPFVTAGQDQVLSTTNDNIIYDPGNLTIFGGTSGSVDSYVRSGSYTGDSSTSFNVTFTVGATGNVVIAWGGHIARRSDWGIDSSAASIPGSPYHMRTGGQDRSLKLDAVIFPGQVTIIKQVAALGATPTMSSTSFPFTATNFNPSAFNLIDNVNGNSPSVAGSDKIADSKVLLFGATNNIVVKEGFVNTWSLDSISCVSASGGTGLPSSDNNTLVYDPMSPNRLTGVSIVVEQGEFVTCTFHNLQLAPSAAPASVSGRVIDSYGRGVSGARITVTEASDGSSHVVLTNGFGYYTVDNLPAGELYVVTVAHKRYTFTDDTRALSLNEDVADLDFIANP